LLLQKCYIKRGRTDYGGSVPKATHSKQEFNYL